MAYQNVGVPRFYVNILEWFHSIGGLTNNYNLDMALTSPVNPMNLYHPTWVGLNDAIWFPAVITPISSIIKSKGFVAHLGHNYKSCELSVQADQGSPDHYSVGFTEDVINSTQYASGRIKCDYDGFSIYLGDYSSQADAPQTNPRLRYDYIGSGDAYNGFNVKVGSIILGSYYDIPHSPDLKLNMTREMDGVKRIRTKGGADLVNSKYTKPSSWGDAGAWELYTGTPTNPALSRSGRRIWDLSFSYLQDSDVWGANQMMSSFSEYTTKGNINIGYESGDVDGANNLFDDNILTSDDFYSQVIHKTNGGQLPFIFQPDSSDNTNFSICKFDMKSFKIDQVANGVYNVKLKIREVW